MRKFRELVYHFRFVEEGSCHHMLHVVLMYPPLSKNPLPSDEFVKDFGFAQVAFLFPLYGTASGADIKRVC